MINWKKIATGAVVLFASIFIVTGTQLVTAEASSNSENVKLSILISSDYEKSDYEEQTAEIYACGTDSGENLSEEVANKAKDKISSELLKLNTTIDVSEFGLTKSQAVLVNESAVNDNPDIFFVKDEISLTVNEETGVVETVQYYLSETSEEIKKMQQELESRLEEIISELTLSYNGSEMTEVDIAYSVYTYLISNIEYGYCEHDAEEITVHHDQTAYGALVEGTCVCAGYTAAYNLIMNHYFGIPTKTISSNSMCHAWNLIMIGDNWYHVDVTWGDGTLNGEEIGYLSNNEYFLCSDEAITKAEHYGWTSDIECTDTTYDNAFCKDLSFCFVSSSYTDGYWYLTAFSGNKTYKCNGENPVAQLEDGNTEYKRYVINDVFYKCYYASDGLNINFYLVDKTNNEEITVASFVESSYDFSTASARFINNELFICIGGEVYDTGFCRTGVNTQYTGWMKLGDKWYYFVNNMRVTGWKAVSGKWYHFDDITEKNYYNSVTWGGNQSFVGTGAMDTGWLLDGDKWYFLAKSGAMVTGWQQIGGKWYYFNGSGVMKTGWVLSGGKWYYLNSKGAMVTGWQQIGGKWYYFNGSGVMKTGWVLSGGKWYYFSNSGAMKTGWLLTGDKWYYFNSSGAMVTGTNTIGGKTYVFDSNGVWIQ